MNDVLDPRSAYEHSASLICARLKLIDMKDENEIVLLRAERIAFQVRKVVEGVAFAALSAAEHRNKTVLPKLRTKDADKLLAILNQKNLLRLPSAQRIEKSMLPDYRMVANGAGDLDISLQDIKSIYKRSSNLIHERHPERHSPKKWSAS